MKSYISVVVQKFYLVQMSIRVRKHIKTIYNKILSSFTAFEILFFPVSTSLSVLCKHNFERNTSSFCYFTLPIRGKPSFKIKIQFLDYFLIFRPPPSYLAAVPNLHRPLRPFSASAVGDRWRQQWPLSSRWLGRRRQVLPSIRKLKMVLLNFSRKFGATGQDWFSSLHYFQSRDIFTMKSDTKPFTNCPAKAVTSL